MKEFVKRAIRAYCPDIKFLRNKMTVIKLRQLKQYAVDEAEISYGESSQENKKIIVEKYEKKWPEYTEELDRKFKEYIEKSGLVQERNDIGELRIKVLFDCYSYGFLPDEYFVYRLENKSSQKKKDYISNRDKDIYSYHANDIIDMEVFFDKYRTYQKYKTFFKREAISVEKSGDFDSFKAFVTRHPIFVQKNVLLSKGESVELVNMAACGKSIRQLFDEMLNRGKYIVEECVLQSETMSKLNASSVNTIRCMTFNTKNGIEIGPCFLKVGQGNSFVDNGGKGGILIGIDNSTGILSTVGYDEFLNEYVEHPDTKTVFAGYQLPDWEKMRRVAVELSSRMPSVRYIGWDLAHTDDGWVVIEGNASGQFIGPQIVWQRGIKRDIQKLLEE